MLENRRDLGSSATHQPRPNPPPRTSVPVRIWSGLAIRPTPSRLFSLPCGGSPDADPCPPWAGPETWDGLRKLRLQRHVCALAYIRTFFFVWSYRLFACLTLVFTFTHVCCSLLSGWCMPLTDDATTGNPAALHASSYSTSHPALLFARILPAACEAIHGCVICFLPSSLATPRPHG